METELVLQSLAETRQVVQLAVLPGTDHMTLVKRADCQVSMIEAFLDATMPKAK